MSEEVMTNNPDAQNDEQEMTGEELHSLEKIRRDKLEALKRDGKNPFKITKYDFNTSAEELKHTEAMRSFISLAALLVKVSASRR